MKIQVGDHIQHRGTKQWGRVLQVVAQRDKTSEIQIERIKRRPDDDAGTGWWASYHVLRHKTKDEVAAEQRLARA
jgi:hypothetical protein